MQLSSAKGQLRHLLHCSFMLWSLSSMPLCPKALLAGALFCLVATHAASQPHRLPG